MNDCTTLREEKPKRSPTLVQGRHTGIQIIGDEQICRKGNGRPKQL